MNIQEFKKSLCLLSDLPTPIRVPIFGEVTDNKFIILEFNSGECIELVNEDYLSFYNLYKNFEDLKEDLYFEEMYSEDKDLLPYIQKIYPSVIKVYLAEL